MKFSKFTLILFFLVIIIPILGLIPWVFTERLPWPDLFPREVTMRGINAVFAKEKNWMGLLFSSLFLSTLVSFFSVIIGLMSARALAFYDFLGKKVIYLMILLPFVIPSTVFGMGAQIMFLKLGLARTLFGVILVHLIYSLPYATKLLYDGTKTMGLSLEEQARVLGASPWQSFLRVGLPILAPVILSAMSMSFIVSFSQYFLTLIIGGGKVQTFSIVMVPYLQSGERSISAAYSIVFLWICILIFALFDFLMQVLIKKRGLTYRKLEEQDSGLGQGE